MLAEKYEEEYEIKISSPSKNHFGDAILSFKSGFAKWHARLKKMFTTSDLRLRDFERIESKKCIFKEKCNQWEKE